LLPRTNSGPSNKQIRGRVDGSNAKDLQALHKVVFEVVGAAKYRKKNLIQFEGFDFLAESEEFDAVVKTIMDVGPANLEYLCWLFVVESGGSAVALGKQIFAILCKQAKERKFATKGFTTASSGDSITSPNDEIVGLELWLERERQLAEIAERRFRQHERLIKLEYQLKEKKTCSLGCDKLSS
jgi:hypothetical protein